MDEKEIMKRLDGIEIKATKLVEKNKKLGELADALFESFKVLKEADDYLKDNKKNYIRSGSKLHRKFKEAIKIAVNKAGGKI